MNFYWIKTNRFIKWLFPKYIWNIPSKDAVYLTFDDGPTPEVTLWVLAQLKNYNAKATFFCIGENIQKHPDIFKQIITDGHSVGNHSHNHLNGWQTSDDIYLNNVALCENHIQVILQTHNPQPITHNLFRPPYGKIKLSQSRKLRKLGYNIIMWEVLSADFDTTISKEKCLQNVIKNSKSGSIVVFHDSIKAFANLEYTLPKVLEFAKNKSYKLLAINN